MKTCGRHNLESNGIPYSTLLPGYKGRTTGPAAGNSSHFLYHIVGSTADALRASPRCVSRLLTLRLRYVFHATSPASGGAPLRLGSLIASERDAPAETLLGLRQGQLYVAGDSDIRLSRCRKGGRGIFCPSIYEYRFRKVKVGEKSTIFSKKYRPISR